MKKIIFTILTTLFVTSCSNNNEGRTFSSVGAPNYVVEADNILLTKIDKKFGEGTVEGYLKEAERNLFDVQGPLSEVNCGMKNYKTENDNSAILEIQCCDGKGRTSYCKSVEYKLEEREKEIVDDTITTTSDNINGEDIKINDYVKYGDYIGKVVLISNRFVVVDGYDDMCGSASWCQKKIKKSEVRKLNKDELKIYVNLQ